jgi:hypothetical protein
MRFIDFSGKWAIVGQHKIHLQRAANPARQTVKRTHQVNRRNPQTGILSNDFR